jgi:glycosyltransferase involved in cell wall biosynthesis
MREELVRNFRIPATKVLVMEHGCEMEISGLPSEIGVSPVERNEKRFSLLFFGVVAPYKGLDLLLKVFDELEDTFALYIAGRCVNSSYSKQIQDTISNCPARDRIVWRNEYVPEEEVARIFTAADALVLPYRHIDQSGVLFQAFRFGVPVVASRVGEFGRYVSKDYGEVFAAGDPDDLRAALRRVYRRRCEFSREKILARGFQLDWRNTVTVLKPVYWF